jgi:hypothetical protein
MRFNLINLHPEVYRMQEKTEMKTLTVRLPKELHFKSKSKACTEMRTFQSVLIELLKVYVNDVKFH